MWMGADDAGGAQAYFHREMLRSMREQLLSSK
jgi:hypothetical protein